MSEHTQSQHTNTTGTMLGRYRILQRLGRGGMGDVWLAEDPRLHRQVAIKTLPVRKQHDHEYVERFEREARAAATLNHPHILPVHDYGRHVLSDQSLITYIVMPYLKGGSLAERIAFYAQKHQPMPIQEALGWLMQAAEAIDYAHDQAIIHRDIKPENMLLREDTWLMLADFGIARILTDSERLTSTGLGFGTAAYMAPEQASGQAVSSSDNYSLAVVAYQICTGRLPFDAETNYAITIQHLTMPPPSPRQFNPHLSSAFEQALLHGLAKQPAERPPSARAFVAALRNAATIPSDEVTYRKSELTPTGGWQAPAQVDRDTTRPTTLQTEPQNSSLTRRRLLIGGGAAVVVAGGGLAAWELLSRHQPGSGGSVHNSTPTTSASPATRGPDAPFYTLTGFNFPATALTWHPRRNLLAAASAGDGWIIAWDTDTLAQQPDKPPAYLQRKYLPTLDSDPVVAWSVDDTTLAITSYDTNNQAIVLTFEQFDASTRSFKDASPADLHVPSSNASNFISGFAFFQKKYLLSVEEAGLSSNSTNALLFITDLTQSAPKPQQIATFNELFTSLAVSPDGSNIAVSLVNHIQLGQVAFAGNTPQWKALVPPLQETGLESNSSAKAQTLAWTRNGTKIISSIAEGDTFHHGPAFWNWRDAHPQAQLLNLPNSNGTPPNPISIVSNPASDTPAFAVGYDTGEINLWNTTANTDPVRTLETDMSQSVVALAWSHDGQWLAASFADTNASILLWKLS